MSGGARLQVQNVRDLDSCCLVFIKSIWGYRRSVRDYRQGFTYEICFDGF